jgi:hypothetical protein
MVPRKDIKANGMMIAGTGGAGAGNMSTDGNNSADNQNSNSLLAAASGNSYIITYDVQDSDSYLLDHKISGRAIFPATGHLQTMWDAMVEMGSCDSMEDGVEFRDFEILQAVVMLPPKWAP